MNRPVGERPKGKTGSFLKQARGRVFDPSRLALALAGPIHVPEVFPGSFGEGEQAIDNLRVLVRKVFVFMNIFGQVEQLEWSFAFGLSPIGASWNSSERRVSNRPSVPLAIDPSGNSRTPFWGARRFCLEGWAGCFFHR